MDITIIGAGIVGLSTAWQLLRRKPDCRIQVLEKEGDVAMHQTGRNSGVIHSGIYYTPGSLKALNCVRGHRMLLDFCREYGVQHEVCGKVIVATRPEEVHRLDGIAARGIANGLSGLRLLDGDELRERYEPYCRCLKAIHVPQTGIVDYKGMSDTLARLLTERGVRITFHTRVHDIVPGPRAVRIHSSSGVYESRHAINCAGLYADTLALRSDPALPYRIIPFRGEYFELKKERQHLVRHLIYPVPNPAFPFLGVHFTRMATGGVEAGPNAVPAFRREGYTNRQVHLGELMDTLRFPGFRTLARRYWREGLQELVRSYSKRAFVRTLQQLIPDIADADLLPAEAGVRAMACHRNGALVDDFLVLRRPGITHVVNAPSPAATACLAVGEHIAAGLL